MPQTIVTQTKTLELNLPVNIKIENWTNKDVVLEALNILHNKTKIAVDTTKVIAVEKTMDSCEYDPNNCSKVFIMYLPGYKIWLRYDVENGKEYVDAVFVVVGGER
jgi:hypothetical protein